MASNRIFLAAGLTSGLALLGVSTVAWAQRQTPQYHGPHMWDGSWHGWFFGPIMMIVFIAVAVGVVVFLVRRIGGSSHGASAQPPPLNTPLDILKERFARGEIDPEEFEERRRLLEN